MDRLWRSNSSINSKTGCPSDIVNDEDHNVEKHSASVLKCLSDTRSTNFKDNIFGKVSLNDDPVYFSYYSKASSPYSKTASKEEGYGKSVDSDFSPIDNSDMLSN